MPTTIDTWLRALERREALREVIITLLLIAMVAAMRRGLLKVVRRTRWRSERDRLRWAVQVKRGALAMLVLGLVLVWGPELRTMAISMVAIAAAIAIATKELILCVMGGLLRSSSRSFGIGDRIETAGVRGDVVDVGWLAFSVLEIGPGHQWTGRALTVPNAVLLSTPVINETFSDDYVLHIMTLPVGDEAELTRAEEMLLAAANEVCGDYLEEARRYLSKHAAQEGRDAPSVEPRCSVQLLEADKVQLLLRLPTPARSKGDTEQLVLRRFLELRSALAA
jgi:small-conductance mechanosensitive channel